MRTTQHLSASIPHSPIPLSLSPRVSDISRHIQGGSSEDPHSIGCDALTLHGRLTSHASSWHTSGLFPRPIPIQSSSRPRPSKHQLSSPHTPDATQPLLTPPPCAPARTHARTHASTRTHPHTYTHTHTCTSSTSVQAFGSVHHIPAMHAKRKGKREAEVGAGEALPDPHSQTPRGITHGTRSCA